MGFLAQILAQADTLSPELSPGATIVGLLIAIITIIGWWRMFEKSGRAGWLAVIPIVNAIVYILISGRPLWWIILLLIPFVNIIILFLIHQGVAERFGQGALFALGLLFLTPIFVIILGFGDASYQGA